MNKFLRHIKKQGKFSIKSLGNSMKPLFYPGDVLYVRKTDFNRLKVHDLIIAEKDKRCFAHRIIYRTDKYLITKGDNNFRSDGKIYPKQVIGKIFRIKRKRELLDIENFYLIQSSIFYQEIVRIKKNFQKMNIKFVFLKGLPVYLYYYGTHPRRLYADCDLLVYESDFPIIDKLMSEKGYIKPETSLTPYHKLLKNKLTEISYMKILRQLPVVLDIHFEPVFLMNQIGSLENLYPRKLVNRMTSEFISEARTIEISKEKFPILSEVNLIIYLALHFFRHNYRNITRLEFIDKVVKKELLYFSSGNSTTFKKKICLKLKKKMIKFRLQAFIFPVFKMLEKYFKLSLPDSFLNSIKPENNKISYFKKNILTINVFDDEPRIKAGLFRFKKLYFLSDSRLYKKLFIFLSPAVFFSMIWIVSKKFTYRVKRFFS